MGELDFGKAERSYRSALAADPAHEEAAAALAILFYERQRFDEMAEIAQRAGTALPGSARVRFAHGLALLQLGNRTGASDVLEAAYGLLTDREQQTVASIAPLMRPADARQYETLGTDAREARERAYWELADPLLLTSVNEARLAFLGRVAYADLMFSTPDLGIRGALTDRGKIVLQYGEPPIVATFAPDVAWSDNAESQAKVTTVWYYPKSELRFVFVGPPAFSTAWFAGDFRDYATQLRYEQPVRYDELPGGLTVDTIPVQYARFRGARPLTTYVEVHAGIPTGVLAASADLDRVPVETALLILDGARRRVVDERDTIVVRHGGASTTRKSYEREFVPGEYGFRVEALESQANKGARALGTLSILSFPSESFSVSDVLLASSIDPRTLDPRGRNDVIVEALADMTLDPGQPLGLYWESYGARADTAGMYRLQIEISLTILELNRAPTLQARLFGGIADAMRVSAEGSSAVKLQFPRSVPVPANGDDRVVHHLMLQLEGAPPAEYRLELTMTDLTTGQTSRTTRNLNIRRPQ